MWTSGEFQEMKTASGLLIEILVSVLNLLIILMLAFEYLQMWLFYKFCMLCNSLYLTDGPNVLLKPGIQTARGHHLHVAFNVDTK